MIRIYPRALAQWLTTTITSLALSAAAIIGRAQDTDDEADS